MRHCTARVLFASALLLAACGGDTGGTTEPPVDTSPERWSGTRAADLVGGEQGTFLLLRNDVTATLQALSTSTGDQLWSRAMPAGTSAAFPVGSVVFVANLDGGQAAVNSILDGATGTTLWSAPRTASAQNYALLLGSTVVLPVSDTSIAGYDRTSGQRKWQATLATVSCAGRSFCNFFHAIGTDGTTGYLLRRSEGEARIITVGETGVVREVVTTSAALRSVFSSSQMAVVKGAGLVAVWSQFNGVDGVDVTTGAPRWQTDYASLTTTAYTPIIPTSTWFSPDGALLLLRLPTATGLDQRVLSATTGALLSSRSYVSTQLVPDFFAGCGTEGYAQLTNAGLEYTNLRTGAVQQLARTGLFDAAVAGSVRNALPLGSNRILLYGNNTYIGVKCVP